MFHLLLLLRWIDQMGNVHGRIDSVNANAEALLFGSHLVIINTSSAFLPYIMMNMIAYLFSVVD